MLSLSLASAAAQGAADVAFPCTIRFCNEPLSASQKHQQSLQPWQDPWRYLVLKPSHPKWEAAFDVGAAHRKDALRSPPTPSQSPFPSLRSSSSLPGGKKPLWRVGKPQPRLVPMPRSPPHEHSQADGFIPSAHSRALFCLRLCS